MRCYYELSGPGMKCPRCSVFLTARYEISDSLAQLRCRIIMSFGS